MQVKVVVLDHGKDLPIPAYETTGSAGMDLRAAIDEPIRLTPMERALVPNGIKIALPQGYEAQVRPRSGLAVKHGVTVLNTPGTVDSDYRGELKTTIINLGSEPFLINRGDRIAQMIIAPVIQAEMIEVESLDETERGEGGFGSTGV
jgi:dUTP pyrophosphatase